MVKTLPLASAAAALVFALAVPSKAQTQKKPEAPASKDNPFIIRHTDPNAACKFAAEYKLIEGNKNDPRVAYIELDKFVSPENESTFSSLCDTISGQTEDTHVLFDKAHGFLHLVTGQEVVNSALAYFAGGAGKPGVILYVKRFDTDFHSFVFTYADRKWQNVTERYLGPLHLQKNDFIIVPQYGRTARVLAIDPKADPDTAAGKFHQKLWIRWTGDKFEPAAKPADWRCPDSYNRFFPAADRAQYCR
jgi:hypothetical protein